MLCQQIACGMMCHMTWHDTYIDERVDMSSGMMWTSPITTMTPHEIWTWYSHLYNHNIYNFNNKWWTYHVTCVFLCCTPSFWEETFVLTSYLLRTTIIMVNIMETIMLKWYSLVKQKTQKSKIWSTHSMVMVPMSLALHHGLHWE